MKKVLIKLSSVFLSALLLCTLFAGCDPAESPAETEKHQLDPPQVAIGLDGVAVWSNVEYALYYIYTIDDGEGSPTVERSVQLTDGQTFRVMAVSGKDGYDDSDFSAPMTYHAEEKPQPDDHAHTDVNSDGACDRCGESVMAELSFYAVNDLHGKFMDTSAQPGLDEFTTYMKDLYGDPAREEILLSSGDMWQGTVESSSNKGQLMTEWMNELGFVSMTLGNHEYDWGANVLTPNSELAKFPFLAINVRENGVMPTYCKASATVERGGVKIGIIGAIGDCLSSISGEFQTGLSFATGSALTTLVKNESVRLRDEEGCDFIVYSIHDGGEDFSSSGTNRVNNSELAYYDTELSDGYVDLVFEAHTHQRYILQDEYDIYHLQGGGENKAISCAEVSFNTVTKEYTVTPKIVTNSVYAKSSIEDDPIVEELYGRYFPQEDPYAAIGNNARKRDSDTIETLIAQLYYEKGVQEWGDTYDMIACGGGYLNTRNPYDLAAGSVSYANIFSLLPFDNDIVLCEISGSKLNSLFLNSSYYRIYRSPQLGSVSNNKKYYVVTDTYTSFYRTVRPYATEVERIKGVYARDLLADYIRAGNWAK